ncbi:MAG: ATP-binding protein [Candidatus Hermodarchaeota archaeon]
MKKYKDDVSQKLKKFIKHTEEQLEHHSKFLSKQKQADLSSLKVLEASIKDFIQFVNQKMYVEQIIKSYRIQAALARNTDDLFKITVNHILKFSNPDYICANVLSTDKKTLVPEYIHYSQDPAIAELLRTSNLSIKDKIISEAFDKKQLIDVKDAKKDPRIDKELVKKLNLKNLLLCPLLTLSGSIGVFILSYTERIHEFSDLELELTWSIIEHFSLEFERQRVIIREKDYRLQLETFGNLSTEIISLQSLEKEMFAKIASEIVRISDYERVLISIFDENTPHMRRIVAYAGVADEDINRIKKFPINREKWLENVLPGIHLTSSVIYVPHTLKNLLDPQRVLFGVPNKPPVQGQWHHEDNLFVLLKSTDEDVLGAISVDTSKSRKIPTSESIRPLELFAFQITEIMTKNRLYKRMITAQEELQLFLDLIAHDIKSMNHAALNSLELLLMSTNLPQDQKDLVEGTQLQLTKSENLLQNVRKLLEIRSTDVKPHLDPIEIRSLIERTIKTLEKVYPSKNIAVTFDGLSIAEVKGDSLLEEVFFNLLDNAIKFNSRKKVKIDVAISSYTNPEDEKPWIKVEIKDYGRGVPDSLKNSVFRRFSRHGGKSIVGGSGLGLSISQGIINRLSGKIWVENRIEEDYKKGANFVVLLEASD